MSGKFQPVEWSHNSNIYEVNVRQYTTEGTFSAFGQHLPRLRDMGVGILWFMPITPISFEKRLGSLGSYYACSDYVAVNPEFGNIEDFKNLVREAHSQGFRVIIDWVANHTGWDHRWTKEHPDFYKRNHDGHFFDAHGWKDVIDLNYDNRNLREAMKDAMKFWVRECDIDGFRCDMAMLVPLDFWREAREELDTLKKLFWLAESEEPAYQDVFDAHYTWTLLHKMESYWRKETGIDGLDQVLMDYDRRFPATGMEVFFTSNHDENSHSGSEYERMGDSVLPFAVLCCTWNGMPMIYSGQEQPNRKRLRFFDKDPIDWTGRYELHDFFKTLLGLRKRKKSLRGGDPQVRTYRVWTGADNGLFAFLRHCATDEVLVLLNLSAETIAVRLEDPLLKGTFKESFTGASADFSTGFNVSLPSWGYQVFEKTVLTSL